MRLLRRIIVFVVIFGIAAALVGQTCSTQPQRPRRIAVFGSSVAWGAWDQVFKDTDRLQFSNVTRDEANGTGSAEFKVYDFQGKGTIEFPLDSDYYKNVIQSNGITFVRMRGYQGHLKERLGGAGWEVIDSSKPGDNTPKALTRYSEILEVKPGYVFIGLSLANEGIKKEKNNTREKKQAVFDQFRDGMLELIRRVRADNMIPVVGLCYPHDVYKPIDYEFITKMNLLMNSRDVPSVNFLGAVGDGKGHWAPECGDGGGHPNAKGHYEMYLAIVPSLFDALEAGKLIPTRSVLDGFLKTADHPVKSVLTFTPADPIHSHAVAFYFRSEADNDLAAIQGNDKTMMIACRGGKLVYESTTGSKIADQVQVADGQWHFVVLSHRWALGQTQLFVDGRLAGQLNEQLTPESFMLAGPNTCNVDYRDWFVYRAALNPLEIEHLLKGNMIQASLEIYIPFRHTQSDCGQPFENRAQSLSGVVLKTLP